MMMEDDPIVQMGVAANLARMYASDQRGFLENLAAMLESVLPEHVTVERRGGLFSDKRIRAVRIQFGDHIYSVEASAQGAISADRTKVVRGIKLKTEPLSIEDWLERVCAELSRHADANLAARDAIKRFLGE